MNKAPFVIIPLEFPVQLADKLLTEVTLKRPTLDDELKYFPASNDARKVMQEEACYFAHLCNLPMEEFRQLDLTDYERVQQQFLSFRGKAETVEGVAANSSSVE